MKISIAKNNEDLTEDYLDNHNIIYISKYSTLIFFFKVIVAIAYAFGLGYSLFFVGDEYIKVGKIFLALLIISYICLYSSFYQCRFCQELK